MFFIEMHRFGGVLETSVIENVIKGDERKAFLIRHKINNLEKKFPVRTDDGFEVNIKIKYFHRNESHFT